MEVVYKLWEGSWEDDAVLRDRERGLYADPSKVHRVRHEGKHYRVDALHLAEPSPQRTPVLYQAGASARGKDFGAKHAECIFLAGPNKESTRATVADIRRRAAEQGRDPSDIVVFLGRAVVVGRTRKEAEEKYEEYHRYASIEGALAHFSIRRVFDGFRGVDQLIWALAFVRAVGLGPLAGVLAITAADICVLAKLFAEAIENADKRQTEGIAAVGASRLLVIRFGLLPQVLPVLLAQALYSFESNTRSAAILGVVGAGGIGLQIAERIRVRYWDEVSFIIILILITVAVIDQVSARVRRRLIG